LRMLHVYVSAVFKCMLQVNLFVRFICCTGYTSILKAYVSNVLAVLNL